MSEKELNNTIFLMYLVTENYKKAHSMTNEQFLEQDSAHGILRFVCDCPEIFDSMNPKEMVDEIDQYVSK